MTDDAGRRKPDRWRRRRTEDAALDDGGQGGPVEGDTDASGWLAAQFQEPGDADAGRSGRRTMHTVTGNAGGRDEEPALGREAERSPTDAPELASPTGGFRWGLKPQVPLAPRATPPAAPRATPPAPAPAPTAPLAGPVGDPFLPADPHVPIVPPGLPITAAPAVPPASVDPLHDASIVPPPDRVLPTELFTPVQQGEPTEPLVSRRTFQPRMPADPVRPGDAPAPTSALPPAPPTPVAAPTPPLDPSLTAPLVPATVHRDSEDSPLAALFREREHRVAAAEPTVRMPSVPPPTKSPASPLAPRRGRVESRRVPGSGWSGNTRLLLWAGGAVLAVLALIGLFFLGTRLPELFGSAPAPASETNALERVGVSPSPTPSATPSPSPSAPPVSQVAALGPLAPGTYSWEELRGGECLSGYESPWAEEFTVVDCAVPHPAQLVHRAAFAPADPTAYPGVDALQAQINLLCSAPTVIDFAAAGAYNDIQFAGSYAANQQEWAAGQRDYFCFVSRSSGEPLTGSIAVPVS